VIDHVDWVSIIDEIPLLSRAVVEQEIAQLRRFYASSYGNPRWWWYRKKFPD